MLAVSGGKGGSGKTTTALGIGTVLAKRRREPILVDADVDMPNLHIRAGVDDKGIDRLADGSPVAEAVRESDQFPGIDVAGARPGAPLERALRALVTDRPVVLDGVAGASEKAVTPLRHADFAVVVTRDTPASITDAGKTIQMARAVGTPVVAAIASRASDVSRDISATLPVDTIVPVPAVDDPISHEDALAAYSRIVDTWINA